MRGEFEAFYAGAKDSCLRAMVASTGDRELAQDLVAEAFARAWSRWAAVRRHPSPEAWVMRTALNLNVSWWRRRRREPQIEHLLDVGADDDHSRPDLIALLATLPERQRQVLALRVFLELDTRQTADVLGIAEGTVTAHLARATAALRTRLNSTDLTDERTAP